MTLDLLILLALTVALQVVFSSAPLVSADEIEIADVDVDAQAGEAVPDSGLSLLSAEEEAALATSGSKHTFGAEVNKLMQIIINSLYTNNEVFLRELISNASDALDKIRFLSLTDASALGEGETAKLQIKLQGDVEKNTLTITDSGVGMTKADLVANLGTIAQSGTKDFLQKFQEYSDSNLIGQFGVGFYSVFLVADSVTVVTKNNADVQLVWQSTADGSFTVAEDPRGNTLGRGTQIIIHLKEDASEYAQVETLKRLVGKYSEFITFPIAVWSSHPETKEVPMDAEELAEQLELERAEAADDADADEEEALDLDGDGDADADGDADSDEDGEQLPEKTTKEVTETVWSWEVLNNVKPLWARSPDEISDDEYREFYKTAMKEHQDPAKWTHFSAEGEIEFKALLFVPGTPPPGMFDGQQKADNMKLFVRRVFITDDFSDILPKYLAFIRGLVDSDDLPLNVSREQLQQHKTLKIIRKKLIRKVIAMFQQLAKAGGDEWTQFYENYGTALKLGAIEDSANRSRLSKLLQFESTTTGELTFLEDYVARAKKDQEAIFYLAGQSKDELLASPLLERFRARGVEVLLMTDPIDEYVTQNLAKFDGKFTLTNIGKEGVKLPGDDASDFITDEMKEQFAPLTDFLKEQIAGVGKAVLSARLVDSPAALVSGSFGYSANMERIVKAQALGDKNGASYMMNSGKTLEINPRSSIVRALLAKVEADETDAAKSVAELLYETARLRSGFEVADASAFAAAINDMLATTLGTDVSVEAYEEQIDEEDEEDEDEEEEDEEEEEEEEEENTHDEL